MDATVQVESDSPERFFSMPARRKRDTQSSPLEVTTATRQPPAPTPSDSPHCTPSNSLLEPELLELAISSSSSESWTTPSPPMRIVSPGSSFPSVSFSQSSRSHQSQRSFGSDAERRSKKGDEDYIRRPENAFILFRRKCCEERQAAGKEAALSGLTKKLRQLDLSKTISKQWKTLPPDERKDWEELAKEKRREHQQLYPDYIYRPQRVRDKDGKARNKKRKRKAEVVGTDVAPETDGDTMSFIVPPRQHGRSASAPSSPPLSQSIQVPNLHSAINGNSEIMANFDLTEKARLGKGFWPDDFIDAMQNHTSSTPSSASPNSDLHLTNKQLAPPAFGQEETSPHVKPFLSSETHRELPGKSASASPVSPSDSSHGAGENDGDIAPKHPSKGFFSNASHFAINQSQINSAGRDIILDHSQSVLENCYNKTEDHSINSHNHTLIDNTHSAIHNHHHVTLSSVTNDPFPSSPSPPSHASSVEDGLISPIASSPAAESKCCCRCHQQHSEGDSPGDLCDDGVEIGGTLIETEHASYGAAMLGVEESVEQAEGTEGYPNSAHELRVAREQVDANEMLVDREARGPALTSGAGTEDEEMVPLADTDVQITCEEAAQEYYLGAVESLQYAGSTRPAKGVLFAVFVRAKL